MKSIMICLLLLISTRCMGQVDTADGEYESPYRLDASRETVLLGGGLVAGITGLLMINTIRPLTPEQIAGLDPAGINAFDRRSIGAYREDVAADVLLCASFLLPLNFLWNEKMKRDWQLLGVMGAEVVLIQSGLNAIIKSSVLRTRPYAYDPATAMDKKTDKDARVSFYSGHTATAAALSFYVARVFSDYLEGSRTETLIWTAAFLYPAVVGYLRVDSAHHFPTDVISGYAIGALIGYFIPALHKQENSRHLSFAYRLSADFSGISLIYGF
jgi:membrane-associated phospholipid phosphatase